MKLRDGLKMKDRAVVGVTGHHQGIHYASHDVLSRHVGVTHPHRLPTTGPLRVGLPLRSP
jgi:hypothetical protein